MFDELERLSRERQEMLDLIRRLLQWDANMGWWDGAIWEEARASYQRWESASSQQPKDSELL